MTEHRDERPLAAIVLAAGQGKRMGAPGAKVLVEACGKALVEHVLDAVAPLEPAATVVVHGHGGAAVREALESRGVRFAHQPEQNGTGHAVQCALPELRGFRGDVLVLCGDTPLLTTGTLSDLIRDHRAGGRALTVLSAVLDDAGSLGRIVRGPGGELRDIREKADATPEELEIREINTGVVVVDSGLLPGALDRLDADNAQGELYLTDVPRLLLQDGRPVGVRRARDHGAALGVNDRRELAEAIRLLRARAVDRLLDSGVWIEDPASTVVDSDVEVGKNTVLGPFTRIETGVRVGRGCRVGAYARLERGAVLEDAVVVGERVTIRAGAQVARGQRIQAGSEHDG